MTTQVGKILTINAHTTPFYDVLTLDDMSANKTWSYDDAPVTAGNFVVGVAYKIATVGTTDFTLIGSPNNTVGTVFVARANPPGDFTPYGMYPHTVGTGTGTATVAGITLLAQPLPAAGQLAGGYSWTYPLSANTSITGAPQTPGSPYPTQKFVVEILYLTGTGPDLTQTVQVYRGLALTAANAAFGLSMT